MATGHRQMQLTVKETAQSRHKYDDHPRETRAFQDTSQRVVHCEREAPAVCTRIQDSVSARACDSLSRPRDVQLRDAIKTRLQSLFLVYRTTGVSVKWQFTGSNNTNKHVHETNGNTGQQLSHVLQAAWLSRPSYCFIITWPSIIEHLF